MTNIVHETFSCVCFLWSTDYEKYHCLVQGPVDLNQGRIVVGEWFGKRYLTDFKMLLNVPIEYDVTEFIHGKTSMVATVVLSEQAFQ